MGFIKSRVLRFSRSMLESDVQYVIDNKHELHAYVPHETSLAAELGRGNK